MNFSTFISVLLTKHWKCTIYSFTYTSHYNLTLKMKIVRISIFHHTSHRNYSFSSLFLTYTFCSYFYHTPNWRWTCCLVPRGSVPQPGSSSDPPQWTHRGFGEVLHKRNTDTISHRRSLTDWQVGPSASGKVRAAGWPSFLWAARVFT